jgi:hypothetical protein
MTSHLRRPTNEGSFAQREREVQKHESPFDTKIRLAQEEITDVEDAIKSLAEMRATTAVPVATANWERDQVDTQTELLERMPLPLPLPLLWLYLCLFFGGVVRIVCARVDGGSRGGELGPCPHRLVQPLHFVDGGARAIQTRARLLPALKMAHGRSKHGHVCCPP